MTFRGKIHLPPVVLVEDDENDLVLINRAFDQAQIEHPVLIAHNGEEAIGLLQPGLDGLAGNSHVLPCLLISDLKMPKLDGFELLLWLQTQPRLRPIPKLVLSSSSLEEDQQKSLALGATAYFAKPNNYVALVQLVREWKRIYLAAAAEA